MPEGRSRNACKQQELAGLEFLGGHPRFGRRRAADERRRNGALDVRGGPAGAVHGFQRPYPGESGGRDPRRVPWLSVVPRPCRAGSCATLKGARSSKEQIANWLKVMAEKRWRSQPPQPSAGCIFKNPKEIPGKLIEELGLKGSAIGMARVSEVHGNFIVNEGGATADDALQLIELIRTKAQQERGIQLETEVMILGD